MTRRHSKDKNNSRAFFLRTAYSTFIHSFFFSLLSADVLKRGIISYHLLIKRPFYFLNRGSKTTFISHSIKVIWQPIVSINTMENGRLSVLNWLYKWMYARINSYTQNVAAYFRCECTYPYNLTFLAVSIEFREFVL